MDGPLSQLILQDYSWHKSRKKICSILKMYFFFLPRTLFNLSKFINYLEVFTYLINRFNAKGREINR